jgi:hypothetical protein
MNAISIRDRFPEVLGFERDLSDVQYHPLSSAKIALEGLFTLAADLFEPLTVEVALACCDAPTGTPLGEPDDKYRQLELEGADPSLKLRPSRVASHVDVARAISIQSITGWLERQLAFDCNEAGVPGWGGLHFNAIRAALPQGLVEAGREHVTLNYGRGELRYPVVREHGREWVSGPLKEHAYASPIRVDILQDANFLAMSLTLAWTLWSDEDGGAFSDVQRSVERLTRTGWDIDIQ